MPKRLRCAFNECSKKLPIWKTVCKCKCGKTFCEVHEFSTKHNCTFDYKNQEKNRLITNNPVVTYQKISMI